MTPGSRVEGLWRLLRHLIWPVVSAAFLRRVAFSIVVCASVVHAVKGIQLRVSWNMWPYWTLTYRHGFVRRATVGALFQSFASGLSEPDQQALAQQIHVGAWLLFVLLLILDAMDALKQEQGRHRFFVAVGAASVFLSHLVPTIGSLAAYLDVYVLLAALVTARMVRRRRWVSAGLLASVAPFVHDGFIFVWLTVVMCALLDLRPQGEQLPLARPRAVWSLLPLAIPFVTTAVVLMCHSSTALERCLSELPPSTPDIRVFEMPLSWMLARMYDTISHNLVNLALATIFFGWSCVITIVCAAKLGGSGARAWIVAVAGAVLPCTILVVAWDLTRFIVWLNLGAFITLCHRAARLQEAGQAPEPAELSPRTIRFGTVAVAALVVAAVGGPTLFSYFGASFAHYRAGPRLLARTPAAHLAYLYVRVYNRSYLRDAFSSRNAEKCSLEARGVELDRACSGTLTASAAIDTPALMLRPGRYAARVRTHAADCSISVGTIEVRAYWRLAPRLDAAAAFDSRRESESSVTFDVDSELAAMGDIRIEVRAREGCFRVNAVEVERVSPN